MTSERLQRGRWIMVSIVMTLVAAVAVVAWNVWPTEESVVVVELDHPTYATESALRDESDLVLVGVVATEGVTTDDGSSVPHTESEIQVETVVKGESGLDAVIVAMTGGVVHGKRFVVEDIPVLVLGKRYLMYLHLGIDGKYYPYAGGAAVAEEAANSENAINGSRRFTLSKEVTGKDELVVEISN